MATSEITEHDRVIGHLDLLGAQSLAVTEPDEFARCLLQLKATLVASAALLGEKGAIYAFADCVYFEAESLHAAVNFASCARRLLLAGSTFFKCGISPGRLGAQKFGAPRGRAGTSGELTGILFGTEVIPVYQLHNALNGVGISVSREFTQQQRRDLNLFENVFIGSNRQTGTFTDVLVSSVDAANSDTLRSLSDNVRRLRYRNRELPRKYLPLLINLIRSTDFSEFDLLGEGGSVPPVLEIFGTTSKGNNSLASLPWFPLIQMVLADQFEKAAIANTPDQDRKVLRRIFGRTSSPPIDLDLVPHALLSEAARKKIMKSFPL
ncbi:hypothetical protein CDL60_18565 [Roseateles noduli]|nr:hypothetical protein CDL60_18565 [Roseateles noduli]